METASEKTPLLHRAPRLRYGDDEAADISSMEVPNSKEWNHGSSSTSIDSTKSSLDNQDQQKRPGLGRHITLFHAISLIIGICSGCGIFVTPTGVTQHVGSVGSTLLVWLFCGGLNILLALCYAELGTVLPVAGGDYAYLLHIFGPFPAFMSLWVTLVLMAPGGIAIISRTSGIYFSTLFDLECQEWLIATVALSICFFSVFVNSMSVAIAAKVNSVLSIGKILAMSIIILLGIYKISEGNTQNFQSPFEGSVTEIGDICLGLLPGFSSYIGWDGVCAMAEEMTNPYRDLPLASVIGLSLVTLIYILINMSYFTVLTTGEFLESSAVATTFVQQVLPSYIQWIVPLFIAMAASGTLFSLFMMVPRTVLAAGRVGALPKLFSFVHVQYNTPLPAIILMASMGCCVTAMVFLDVQILLQVSGLAALIKIAMTITALIYMKIKMKSTKQAFKVPLPLVFLGMLCLSTMILLSAYSDPVYNGAGCIVFLLGFPFYYISNFYRGKPQTPAMRRLTHTVQKACMVAPLE